MCRATFKATSILDPSHAYRLVFKHTQNTSYLETSRRMADYFLDNLPEDGIVPWYVTPQINYPS